MFGGASVKDINEGGVTVLFDSRLNCYSVSGVMPAGDYIGFVDDVHKDRGGIEGQRAVLKTKTAIVIRNRMIADIKAGTVLPPVVLGAVLSSDKLVAIQDVKNNSDLVDFMLSISSDDISIIDGMQRTAALKQANLDGAVENHPIRFELWVTENVGSLVYRMLVLNTGQVPWDIKRQLETVYKQVINSVREQNPDMKLIELDAGQRRSFAGEYRAALVVEQFLAFTSRSPHVDIKERVAEDFARMDAADILSRKDAIQNFALILNLLYMLDLGFNFYVPATVDGDGAERNRFRKGMDVFTSAPACIGFVAACASYLLGESGYDVTEEETDRKKEILTNSIHKVVNKIFKINDPVLLEQFMDFASLNEKLSVKVGKVGEYEREFFYKAFSHLIENADRLSSLSPCWLTRVK